ncbi:MAG: UDP-N-acetylmuramoyl-tripeptide--D-alanyl-D-alanine ligase, partial [Oscillospiraceae bacterium]
ICLFGCGGDRDRTKRPLMAKAVEKYADHIIVTSDNPRNEDPEAIINDIVEGFSENTSYDRIADRKEAILHGIKIAQKNDVLVLAGKGHEDYQILADGKHIHFDEREIVAECLKKAFGSTIAAVPQKKEPLTLDEICRAVNGRPFGMNYSPNTEVYANEISSDTRTIKKGALFIGIKGENFDGNAFAEKAVNELGAVCAVTGRIVKNTPCIVVSDTRKALLELAGHFRRKFSPVVVGVTGSVGKTTSKEFLSCALSSEFVTLKTEGNQNNDIGLPFTLFKLNSEIQAAVIEMGMSHPGEISVLSKAAKPDICVITNIGYSHIENLGSKQGILKAKLEILDGAKRNAPLVVNGDDHFLYALKKGVGGHEVITCGVDNPNADYRAVNIISDEDRVEFDIAHSGLICAHCMLPVTGKHYIIDALLAAVTAQLAGCSIIEAADALKSYMPTGLRQHITERNGQKLIIDCYNAAPVSMKAAIDVLCSVKKPSENGKRVCVFGDMLELGDMTEILHREIGKYAAEKKVDLLVCYGRYAKYAAESAKASGIQSAHTESEAALYDFLKMNTNEGDVLLFKGSRAMKLEKIIAELYGEDV